MAPSVPRHLTVVVVVRYILKACRQCEDLAYDVYGTPSSNQNSQNEVFSQFRH